MTDERLPVALANERIDALETQLRELEDRMSDLEFTDLLSVAETSSMLGISIPTVRRLLVDPASGLVGAKISPGRVVIRRSALAAYIKTKERNT